MTSAGTVELRASTDNFVTVDDQLLPESVLASTPAALFQFEAVVEYTSVRIIMRDAANPAGYIEFGKLFIGTAVQPGRNYGWGWSAAKVDLSERMDSRNNVPHFNRRAKKRMPETGFLKVPEEDKLLIEALIDEVGITEPFYVAMDPDNHPEQTYYVRIANALPKPTNDVFARWSYRLDLEEGL